MELQKGILYGPLQSRRLGHSLGVNLLPDSFKLCSLNCCYCQYGWTKQTYQDGREFADKMPSLADVTSAVWGALENSVVFDFLTLCGNGEPTLHPQFAAIVDAVCDLRTQSGKHFGIAVISNSTTCSREDIKSALSRVDLAIMKLDTGNECMFRKLNSGTAGVEFESVLSGLKALDRYVVQAMFVEGAINNSSEAEVNSWLEGLACLSPQYVQVYSLARPAASEKIKQVGRKRLEEIAETGRHKTGFQFDVF